MKSLKHLTDRKTVYRIEAARISFEVLSDSFSSLRQRLQDISSAECDVTTALKVYKEAWQFVDYTFRFLTVVSQIRGLKHKDPRFVAAQRSMPEIERARNFVQHLNSGIPTLSDETYPILGALAWSSDGGQKSHVLSLGRLPQGTKFHTVAYDTDTGTYVDEMLLCVDTFVVSIDRAFSLAVGCHEYLSEWLTNQSLLEEVSHQPTVMTAGPLANLPGAKRFRRVRFVVNSEQQGTGSA